MQLWQCSKHLRVVVVVVAWTLVESMVPETVRAQRQSVEGCYDLYLNPWSPEPLGSDSILYLPPTRVHLTMAAGRVDSSKPYGFSVQSAPGAMPSVHEYSWWEPRGDTLLITFTTGFSGVQLRLIGGDTLRGTAQAFTDVMPSPSVMTVVSAQRVQCNASLPSSRSLSYRYAPVVNLVGGDSLLLDAPLPARVRVESGGTRNVTVLGTPLGVYAGAERIEAMLREDATIRSIWLYYPLRVEFDDIVARLRAAFGQPTSGREGSGRWASWSARLLSISVSEQGGTAAPAALVSIVSERRE